MPERISDDFGRRLAKYRRLAGVSAQELSNRVGGEMSRAVIANIETGRKTDVTLDHWIALAHALNIPPVALLVPLDEPNRVFLIRHSEDGRPYWLSGWEIMNWLLNRRDGPRSDNPAGMIARINIRALYELDDLGVETDAAAKSGKLTDDELQARGKLIDDKMMELRELGVDISSFRVKKRGVPNENAAGTGPDRIDADNLLDLAAGMNEYARTLGLDLVDEDKLLRERWNFHLSEMSDEELAKFF